MTALGSFQQTTRVRFFFVFMQSFPHETGAGFRIGRKKRGAPLLDRAPPVVTKIPGVGIYLGTSPTTLST